MSRIILQKAGVMLMATDEESIAALAKIKDGSEVMAEVVRARNARQHRLFFSLAAIVAEAMDLDVDVIRKDALKRLGHTNTYLDVDGRIVIEAKSMRFVDGMTAEEFDAFMDKAVNLLATWISADRQDLLARYNERAADKRYQDYVR